MSTSRLRRGGAGLLLLAALGATGCSTTVPPAVRQAPVLTVATGLFPLAETVRQIGGDKARVEDPVGPGTDPFRFTSGPRTRQEIVGAGLVVQIGGGFQPGFEAASAGAPRVLDVATAIGARDRYVWLDPTTMAAAAAAIATAMEGANPAAAPLYRQNAAGVEAMLRSLGIDFSATLAACPGRDLVTPDDAFSALAAANGLRDHVAARQADLPALTALLRRAEKVAVITEPWVDNRLVGQLAASTGTKPHLIDTLATAPANGPAARAGYQALMEQDLGQMASALGCNSTEQ